MVGMLCGCCSKLQHMRRLRKIVERLSRRPGMHLVHAGLASPSYGRPVGLFALQDLEYCISVLAAS